MKDLFYLWLIMQLVICGIFLGEITYESNHCLLDDKLETSLNESRRLGGMFPIPLIIGGLIPKVENKNCD